MKKTKYKPTDPELFKVTLFPVENSEDESLRKSSVESVFIRLILEGLKNKTNEEVKDGSIRKNS